MTPYPFTQELVLIGGGHSHALVLRKWGMNPLPGARLTLINPGPEAPYTGMLPGYVAGHYDRDDLMIDMVRLARFAGARLILGAAQSVDLAAKTVTVPGRPPVAYDTLSINVGITSDLPDLPGFVDHATPAKPLFAFAHRWQQFRQSCGAAPRVVMIGGGVGGVELALAIAHALQSDGKTPRITVVDRGAVLAEAAPGTARILRRALDRAQITLAEHTQITQITATDVVTSQGDLPSDLTLGVAGARPPEWLRQTGLTLDQGFLTVNDRLQTSDPDVFAAGDCAALPDPRPKAGVYAVRAAPVLAHNLRAALTDGALRSFRPQRDFLKLISLGPKSAVASKYRRAFAAPWVWRWKDRIDRTFMDQFANLAPMSAAPAPAEAAKGLRDLMGAQPLCGGCGAKVGAGPLADSLDLPGDDAATLPAGDRTQVISTDHLRGFTLDPYLQGQISAVHALGDIWAMGAAPQAALAQITLPPMSARLQSAWLSEIMEAAQKVMHAAGAQIVGGHTSTGPELSVGFTVTGLCDRPVTLAGARPGDALILTQPIGSGTILAGEMALQAKGFWVAEALDWMQQPQAQAAQILRDAHAMTDVTGFGLAGHLMNICRASGVGAQISLEAVPVMTGAAELARRGVRSSLYPANRQATPMDLPDTAIARLLFDPQTAGGLLAAFPMVQVDAVMDQLTIAGYRAAQIGVITDQGPGLNLTD